tara:strand:- start:6032 stop:6925 length:894 start_codon:yes stop_codon:yes gene_type:complete
MSKKISILFIVSILAGSVFGQFVGKDDLSVALFYLQKSELDSAKKYIDLASTNDALKETAKTWYYRGFVYKELYKKKDKENKTSLFRIVSIESFEKMLTLSDKNEFTQSAAKILKYEASTLYNDAARMLHSENYKTASSNYDLFRKTMLLVDANANMSARDVQFKLALAYALNRPLDDVSSVDSVSIYQVKKLYLEVLDIDTNNPAANYNLGILYYNEAAEIINNMDYDMDIMSLNAVQDYCIEIFLKSLPFMKTSYDIEYKRKETLIGLSNIHYGLNDMEKSETYKKELQDLEKED